MIFTIYFNETLLTGGRASGLLNGYRQGDTLRASRIFNEYFLDTGQSIRPDFEMLGMIWKLANDDDRPNGKIERSLTVGDAIMLHDSPICPSLYSVEPLGFDRLHCECEWADDAGDPEVGPSPYIRERDAWCPIHGMNTHKTEIEEGVVVRGWDSLPRVGDPRGPLAKPKP